MTENVMTRKIGPLPTWGWVGITGGVIVAYELYKSRSSAAAAVSSGTGSSTVPQFVNQTYVSPGPPMAPHGEDNDKDDKGKGGTGPFRQVATGTESLNQIAKARGTTVAHIIAITKASHIDDKNLKAFLAAAAHPGRKLPKGTVYYTSNK